ncbi:hypothetical protein K7X08_015098 [Anisodus acutangulus]|uniref:Protein TIC 20 n=1 Tax=Anisodus acutangulus TaxID=402998 RepID=A0A9Q1L5H1_9SOLA|nr:hypothetical protein K7X08_015098 [Anisodus acutangulus]
MAITNLLSTTITPFPFTSHPKHSPFLHPTKRPTIRAQSKNNNNNNDSADGPDRLISAITYFYPFFDGIQYGKYVVTQFAPIQTLIQPLVPAIRVLH